MRRVYRHPSKTNAKTARIEVAHQAWGTEGGTIRYWRRKAYPVEPLSFRIMLISLNAYDLTALQGSKTYRLGRSTIEDTPLWTNEEP